LACILNATAKEVLASYSDIFNGPLPFEHLPVRYYPVAWSGELSAQPYEVIAKGEGNHVPLLLGNCLNESALFDCASLININSSTVESFITGEILAVGGSPNGASEVVKAYPVHAYPTAIAAFNEFQTDFVFRCQTRNLGLAFSAAGQPVFMFSLEHAPAHNVKGYPPAQATCIGVGHSFDLPYLFGSLSDLTEQEQTLSATMRNAWASFVAAGVPILPSSLTWPEFNSKNGSYLRLDIPLSTNTKLRQQYCDLLTAVIP